MSYRLNHSIHKIVSILTLIIALAFPLSLFAQEEQEKEKQEENTPKITEEILVVGKAPKEAPVSMVVSLDSAQIQLQKPLDLSEAIKYAPGATVTVGSKNEFSLKLRGFDNKRIALLVDGVPVIDPYYGSFDLKTVDAGGIDSIQITAGPSSVLYGPNTLGGIVNVITRRPGPEPKLTLNASYGERNTKNLGLDSSYQWKNLGFAATGFYQDSDGFNYWPASEKKARTNSDYKRTNLNLKLYYTPSPSSEIMINGGYYHSEYGMPPDLYSGRPRYWRFPDWDRYMLNAGGFMALGERSTVRLRAFYVQYKNSLDWFKDPAMTIRTARSAFNNSDYGFFGIGDFYLNSWNSLKVSAYYQGDRVKTQDDINLPWTEFDQGTFSAGIEDHLTILEKWKIIAGVSYDAISKFKGENKTKINPLVGLKYSPTEDLDLHVSYSNKSRFPSMNSLYSPGSGNPDLRSEFATTWELGTTYNKGIYVTGSVFITKLKDMINSFRLPSGLRTYFNIGEARLNGAEVQVQQTSNWLNVTVNYTYLDHKNISDNRPLDVLPKHNLTFALDFSPFKNVNLALFGLFASQSDWYDNNTRKAVTVPRYRSLDVVLSTSLRHLAPFIKVSNILNEYFYTEPGFPWRGRYMEIGIKADIF